jgi:hypothetical protein
MSESHRWYIFRKEVKSWDSTTWFRIWLFQTQAWKRCLQMHLVGEQLVFFWEVMIAVFWKRKSRPISWHQCRLLTLHLFSLFSHWKYMNIQQLCNSLNRLIMSLHLSSQRLLTLLIGTFRMISSRATSLHCQTKMSSEALGVSVAPSFFHSCVSDGKNAQLVDVARFKAGEMSWLWCTFDFF